MSPSVRASDSPSGERAALISSTTAVNYHTVSPSTSSAVSHQLRRSDPSDISLADLHSVEPTSGMSGLMYQARRSRLATALVVAMALFTDMLIYGIAVPILPSIVEMYPGYSGETAVDVGVLFGSYALGLLLFTPIFGIMSDRYQTRKTPMLLGLLGLAACTFLFSIAESYWQLLLARFAQGVSGGASWSIGLSMIADVYPASRLGVIMGTVLSANTLGLLLGPPLGGALFQYVGYRAPFYFAGGLALLDFCARLWVMPPSLAVSDGGLRRECEQPASATTGLVEMVCEPEIALTCLATLVVSAVYSGVEPTLPLHLAETFGCDESTVGLLFCAIVVPNIVVAVLVGWMSDRYGRKVVSALGMLLMAIAVPLMAVPRVMWLEVMALMLFGATSATAITPIMPEMAEFVTKRGGGAYGQAYALFNMAYSLGMLGGPLLAGTLYQLASFQWEMVMYAIILAIFAPVLLAVDAYYRRRNQVRIPSPSLSTRRSVSSSRMQRVPLLNDDQPVALFI